MGPGTRVMRKVSVSTALFDGHPLETAIHAIAEAGAAYVEPAFIRGYVDFDETAFTPGAAARLDALIREAGLGVSAVSAHFDLGVKGAADMLVRRIGFAARLGASFLITNAGAKAQRQTVVGTVVDAVGLCESTHVVLALENPGHGSGDLLGEASDGAALLGEIGSDHVRLNYDVGNVLTYSRGTLRPEQDVMRALPVTAHLHLKDVADRDGGWVFTPLGRGDIDFKAIWAHLPPDLPVGIELPLRLERPKRADPIRRREPLPLPVLKTALRESLEFVAGLDNEMSSGRASAS